MLDLYEIKRRCEAASPEPWHKCGANADSGGCKCGLIWSLPIDIDIACVTGAREMDSSVPLEIQQVNADFIAAARTDIPDLVAEVERLRAELDVIDQYVDADGNVRRCPPREMWPVVAERC